MCLDLLEGSGESHMLGRCRAHPGLGAEEASSLWAQPAPWEEVPKPHLEIHINELELGSGGMQG